MWKTYMIFLYYSKFKNQDKRTEKSEVYLLLWRKTLFETIFIEALLNMLAIKLSHELIYWD